MDVDQLVLGDALVRDRDTASGDEPARRVRGQADLGEPPLGHEPSLDHREGALGS
jgi:hypothetical protein